MRNYYNIIKDAYIICIMYTYMYVCTYVHIK